MMATSFMGFFIDMKKILEAQKKSSFLPQFFIGVIIVVFGIAGGGILLLNSSKTYQDAINSIKTDPILKNEIGNISGTGLFPSGAGFLNFAYHVNQCHSTFIITVRGSKAIKDIEISLERNIPVE